MLWALPGCSMRLLQLHEYLDLLAAGGAAVDVPADTRAACLAQARGLWPETGLPAWGAGPREVVACRRDPQGRMLVHIDAGYPDCFLILSCAPGQAAPEAWLLFDVGAEYNPAEFYCPSVDYQGPADDELIDRCIPQLNRHRDPFAVLSIAEGTYLQVYHDESGAYELEHQLVTSACHYLAEGPLDAAAVVAAFKSYARGDKVWATALRWQRVVLQAG